MIKQLKYVLLGILVGALILFAMYRNSSKKDANVLVEGIDAVKKTHSN